MERLYTYVCYVKCQSRTAIKRGNSMSVETYAYVFRGVHVLMVEGAIGAELSAVTNRSGL